MHLDTTAPSSQLDVPRTSRREFIAAAALLGAAGGAISTVAGTPPAQAAVILGKQAPVGGLAMTGTIVGRHRDLFRSFALTSSGGVGVISVGAARYLVTVNSGNGTDTIQIFKADNGYLHFKASTPGKAAGNFVHDGRGTLYMSSGRSLVVVSVVDKTIHVVNTALTGVTAYYAFQIDYQGRLWAGTYPAGVVVCIDPSTGQEVARTPPLGSGNQYARTLSMSPDGRTIWAGTGTADPALFRVDLDAPGRPARVSIPDRAPNSLVTRVTARGRKVFVWYVNTSGANVLLVYDILTKVWSPSPVKFSGSALTETDPHGYVYVNAWGTIKRLRPDDATMVVETVGVLSVTSTVDIGLAGSSLYLITEANSSVSAARMTLGGAVQSTVRYRVIPGPLVTQSMAIDRSTNVAYAGGYRGDGVCSTDLSTGAFTHSAPNAGVDQIEGMTVDQGHLYVGSYGSAVIVKHTASAGVSNANSYQQLAKLGASHKQSRPFAWASTTSHVVFGTVPDYGYRGGALGTIERSTGKVTVYNKLIPELSIVGLAAFGNTVYGTTSCLGGYGSDVYSGDAVVFAADARTGAVLWRRALAGTDQLYGPVLIGTKLFVATLDTIVELNASDGSTLRTFVLGWPRTAPPGWQSVELQRIPGTNRLVHLDAGSVRVLDLATGQVATVLKGAHRHIDFDAQKAMWVTVGNDIVKLRLDMPVPNGAIKAVYDQMGGLAKLGHPVGPEEAVTTDAGILQKFFRNGRATSIYSSSTHGTHAVTTSGAIGRKYEASYAHKSYGMPSSNEVTVAGGAYQVFTKTGKVSRFMWTATHGTYIVKEYKAIGRTWAANGREAGWGWPVSGEYTWNEETRQEFSNGVLAHYLSGKGVWIT